MIEVGMAQEHRTGGCQCGRVSYTTTVDPRSAYLCHCRMCQRATGGVSIAFVSVRQDQTEWTGAPDWYDSSPIAQRPFCSDCGTPLGFRFKDGSENLDLTVGSFDDPSGFVPQHHFGAESIHAAWLDTSQLKRIRTDEHRTLVDKWVTATGSVPG